MKKFSILSRFNRKIVLGATAMLFGVGVIALCSFFPFIIDPSRWQTAEFLSDELIMVAIVIFSTMCLMFISQAANAQNANSEIAKARARFFSSVKRISEGKLITQFSQWVRVKLQNDDIRTMKERMALEAGVEESAILSLDDAQIMSLVGKMQVIDGKRYGDITKSQAMKIKRIKRATIRLVDPSYYLMCSSISAEKTVTEMSGNEGKKKSALMSFSIASRIVMSLLIAMIFASLVYDTMSGVEQAQAWMKFISRMFTMTTSAFMGYMLGCQTNDIDAEYVNMKCIVHDKFFEDAYSRMTKEQVLDERYLNQQEEESDGRREENVKEGVLD